MFSDRLQPKLTLTIGTASFDVTAGSIERFTVDVRTWGFTAQIDFIVNSEQEDDAVFPAFMGSDVLSATFTFLRAVEGVADASGAFKIMGYAVERAVAETVGEGVKGAPVVLRHYRLRLVDAAQAFWTQHRPVELYAAASMEQVLDLHKPVGVALTYDWPILQDKQDILCLSLHGEEASTFYDFVVWYVDRNQGVFELDARTSTYRLGARKAKTAAAAPLDPEDVDRLMLLAPEPPRFAGRVLNPFSNAPATKDLVNATSVTGVHRDVIVRTPISAEVDRRAQVEALRFRARSHGLEVTCKRCPETISQPGDALSVDEGFSDAILSSGNTYRVVRFGASASHGKGTAPEPEDEIAVYDIDMTVEAENADSAVAWLPPFRNPRHIVRLEGTIVSSGGGDSDRSWAAVENDDNSLWTYKVNVPLYNKIIPVPFVPSFISGHFFFPAYKKQRVLVDVDWDRAQIAGFLDWADEARVPSASQGDQIVLGFQSKNGTIIRHDYEDAKPVLQIVRKNEGETSTFQMADGTLRISLDEAVTVPTAVPVFDVSPRVDAAKDEVTGTVGGAVSGVTDQFQGSVSQVSSQVDDTTAAVNAEIGTAEKKLKADLLLVDAELQGLAADASAALMSVNNAVNTSKAKLLNAVGGMDAIKAPLVDLDTRLIAFDKQVEVQIGNVEQDISQIDAGLDHDLDEVAAATERLRDQVKNRLSSLRASVQNLGPSGTAGPFADLATLRSAVSSLQASVTQTSAGADADVGTLVTSLSADWQSVEGDIASRRAGASAKCDAVVAEATSRQAALQAKLDAAVARRGSAAARTEAAILRPGIAGIEEGAKAVLQAARDQVFSSLDTLLSQAKGRSTQAENAARAAGATASQSASSVANQIGPLSASVDRLEKALESALASVVATLSGSVTALDRSTGPALDSVTSGVTAAQGTLERAVASAKEALEAMLGAMRALAGSLDTAARLPVETALAAIDTAEGEAQSLVASATSALDSVQASATTSLQALIDSFLSIVNAATTSIDALKDLITGLRTQITPPIDALGELLGDLESIFQTGANVLTAFIDTAGAALDAIPAVGLPQALVDPAVQAIDAALNAVLPLITQAAQKAGSALSTMATSLLSQIDTAEQAAIDGVSAFVKTLDGQIQAILPPVKQQLATVQAQIDNAVETIENQLAAMTDTAVGQINAAIQVVSSQATTACNAGESALSAATTNLDSAAANVRTQIAAKKAALESQAQTIAAQMKSQLDTVGATFNAAAAGVEQAIDTAAANLRAQFEAGKATLDAQIALAKTGLANVRPALATSLSTVKKQNDSLVVEARAAVPAQAAVDAPLDAAWTAYATRLNALEAGIAQL